MWHERHYSAVTKVLLAAAVCALAGSTYAQTPDSPGQEPRPSAAVDYDTDVRPILVSRCFGCHGPKQAQSGLRLDLRQNALRGGDYGVVIVPGKAAESKLFKRLIGSSAGLQMPPTGELPVNEIETLRAWIDQGADMPGNALEKTVATVATDPAVQKFLDEIANHDLNAVRKSLAANRTLARAADGAGSTSLMHSAAAGTIAIMQTLIDAGADVNAANARKATALHWAMPDAEKVKLLLLKGAQVDAKTVEGRTPLYIAAGLPEGASALRLLLEVGAKVDEPTLIGTTALFPAATTSAEITKLLLDHGANPNLRAKTDATPVLSTKGADVIALLIAAGADVRARSKLGETALMETAIRGDIAGTRLLLDKGADVNAADHRGYTPLLLAAQYDGDAAALVRLLLERGADITAVAEGQTALRLAMKRGETEVTKILREAAAAPRPSGVQ